MKDKTLMPTTSFTSTIVKVKFGRIEVKISAFYAHNRFCSFEDIET